MAEVYLAVSEIRLRRILVPTPKMKLPTERLPCTSIRKPKTRSSQKKEKRPDAGRAALRAVLGFARPSRWSAQNPMAAQRKAHRSPNTRSVQYGTKYRPPGARAHLLLFCYPSPMRTLAILLLAATPALAQDVHVRVSHDVKSGIEATDAFPTIQNALDHHPFPGPGGRVFLEIAPGTYNERHHRHAEPLEHHPRRPWAPNPKTPSSPTPSTPRPPAAPSSPRPPRSTATASRPTTSPSKTPPATPARPSPPPSAATAPSSSTSASSDTRTPLFADAGRQYYVDSYIEGGVDYIFGDATAVFDRCELHSNGPGAITAQSRTRADETTGYVILNSHVTATLDHSNPKPTAITLGRPWRPYARTVFIATDMPADLNPLGFTKWSHRESETTAWYGEANSTGPGATPELLAQRSDWAPQASPPPKSNPSSPSPFLSGKDHWNPINEAAKLP